MGCGMDEKEVEKRVKRVVEEEKGEVKRGVKSKKLRKVSEELFMKEMTMFVIW